MTATAAQPLLVAALGLLGLLTSPLAEVLIARSLPRLGGLPSYTVRITTAVVTAALFALMTVRFGLSPALPAYLLLGSTGGSAVPLGRRPPFTPEPLGLDSAFRRPRPANHVLCAGSGLARPTSRSCWRWHFVPRILNSWINFPRRPRNGRCEARGATRNVLGLLGLDSAVLRGTAGLRGWRGNDGAVVAPEARSQTHRSASWTGYVRCRNRSGTSWRLVTRRLPAPPHAQPQPAVWGSS